MLVDQLLSTLPGTILLASFAHYFFGITLTLTAIFLILLVLVQRGRGGGLAGAFGGMGGQSAFGTKAGDTFTRVTIGVSIFWILLCIASVKLLGTSAGSFGQATAPEQTQFQPGLDGALPPVLPGETPAPTGPSVPGTQGAAPGPSGAPAAGTAAEITPDASTEATGTASEPSENN